MARQPITIGTADSKTGDTLHSAFTKVNANETELYADVAANVAAIALLQGFTKTYWFDDNDTATATTPISHSGGATGTYLTNNGIGSYSNAYNPDSKDRLWDASSNNFDFSSLKIGDTIEFRGDITLDTVSANQEIEILMSLGEGVGPYELSVLRSQYRFVSSGNKITFMFRIYMGDNATRTGTARFRFASDNSASIVVNGWFYQIVEV